MKKIYSLLFIAFAVVLSYGQEAAVPVYSLEKCIDTAIANNPGLGSAQSSLLGAKARVWQSSASFWPTVSASGGYTRSRAEDQVLNNVFNYSSRATAGLSANMTLFTFGKDYYAYKAQQYSYTSSDFDYKNTLIQLVYNVKEAYYNLVYYIKSVDVYTMSVQQYEQQLSRAQSFYKVGIRSKIDVTTAEVNLNTAKLSLIRANNNVKVAYAALNALMGLPKPEKYQVDDNLNFVKYDVTMDDALNAAFANRPDLAASAYKSESAHYTLNARKADYLPDINASASYGLNGDTSLDYENGSVGLSASWPLFNGFRTTARMKEAKASYQSYKFQEEAVRQSIIKDITQSHSTLTQSAETIPVARLNVEKAKENLDLANGRYKVGIGNIIEVKDAETSYRDAELQYAKALTDYKTAEANLLKSMGTR